MIKFILFIFFLFYSFNSYGYEKIHVAVASNFIEPLNLIKKEFLKNYKTSFKISTGSTAKLFAQILNKAPIDIFLSADRLTIQKIPDNKKIKVSKEFQFHDINVWKIKDKSNSDQLRAVTGICFTIISLIVIGMYSNFV